MTPLRLEKFISQTMEETHSLFICADRNSQEHLMSTSQVKLSLAITTWHVMKLNSTIIWLPMVEYSASVELTNQPKISSYRNTKGISLLGTLRSLLLDLQLLYKFLHITALEMKLILLANFMTWFQRNLRLTSLSMSIMIKRSSGILLNTTLRFLKTLIGDLSYHFILLTTLSQSLSLLKRILVF